jgi:hypothetical protein
MDNYYIKTPASVLVFGSPVLIPSWSAPVDL